MDLLTAYEDEPYVICICFDVDWWKEMIKCQIGFDEEIEQNRAYVMKFQQWWRWGNCQYWWRLLNEISWIDWFFNLMLMAWGGMEKSLRIAFGHMRYIWCTCNEARMTDFSSRPNESGQKALMMSESIPPLFFK